jgi:transposase
MNPYPANRSILVMDNCRIHHNIELVDIVNAVGMSPHLKLYPRDNDSLDSLGCLLIYLPPYSPDMNPIEESFSTCMHVSIS